MTKKTTKGAFIASVLSLCVCFTMLIGSTFAWFTDSTSTGVSNIVAGTLDIALYTDEECTISAETLKFKKAAGAENEKVLFEPGAKYELTQAWLKNEGTLHAKYQVVINGIDAENDKLAEVLDVIIDGTNMGTLKSLIANAGLIKEHHIAPEEKQTFGKIELMMQTSANNDYQGLTIDGIAITVIATQYTAENDSFDNKYDENAEYFTTASADDKIGTAGGTLTEDTYFPFAFVDTTGATAELTVDGDGHTVKLDTEEVIYLTSDNGSKVAMNDITMTGEVRYLSLGEYKSATYKNFNAELNNVTASDLKVGYFNADKPVAAIACFGSATLNNSYLIGTTTELTDKIAFDLMGVNYSTVAVNGGHIGKAYVCSNANMTFTNANVDEIITAAHGLNKSGLTIENGSIVNSIKCENYTGSYALYQGRAKITIKSGAIVKILDLTGVTNKSLVTVEEGATVEKVIVNGTLMSFADWQNP